MAQTENLIIRTMHRHDNGSWLKMWSSYLCLQGINMSLVDKILLFRRLTAKSTDVAATIVLADGKPIGFAQYLIREKTKDCERAFELQDVFIDDDWHRSGAGRALIQSIYESADAQGVKMVIWPVSENIFRGRRMRDANAVKSPFLIQEVAA